MKTKLQPLSQLKGENLKDYKRMKTFYGMNSIRGESLFLSSFNVGRLQP